MTDLRDEYEHRLRVRYAETDTGGVAHHSSYAAWLEEARTEWMRARGLTYREVEERGFYLMVTEMRVSYVSPARYDDHLAIRLRVATRKRASLDIEYQIELVGSAGGPGGARRVATAMTRLACTDRDGKVRRLPEGI